MMELMKHRPRRAQRRLPEGPHKRKHDERANLELVLLVPDLTHRLWLQGKQASGGRELVQ